MPLDQDSLANAKATEGRQRLTGAFLIELSRIRPDPNQPRKSFDTQSQWELSASIEKLGILQPITVQYLETDDIYQIITGERRYQAAKNLALPAIPCWVRTPDAKDVLVHQVVENWQRVDLHPFDLADTLMQLRDGQGYSQKRIAVLTGKPESEISKLLSLLKLNPAVQHRYRADKTGVLSRRHLESIAKLPTEEQITFHDEVQTQNLTAKQTERIVQEKLERRTGLKHGGAPVATRRKYVTAKATVTLLFRRKRVTTADVLDALDEARQQAKQEARGVNSSDFMAS